jgi:tetratricopeptide (TPR) repeat protein
MIQLILSFIVFFFFSFSSSHLKQNINIVDYRQPTEKKVKDSLLLGIEEKIYESFVQSLKLRDNTSLKKLSNSLENIQEQHPKKLSQYWQAYLKFYNSIYYLKNGERDNAEEEIDKAIDFLDKMSKKNSEDFALLARLQGFGIQFKGFRAILISSKIKKNAQTALEIDSTNLRAYFVYASNDFYTPEKYGGGKEAEAYLLKAISLPSQKIPNKYLPSWGKEESYEMLIKLYLKKADLKSAKKYFDKGIEDYPNSHIIQQFANKLIEK